MFDLDSRLMSFPSLGEMTYLNTAAEGIPPLEVKSALDEYFQDKQLGMDGRDRHFAALEEARGLVGEFFGMAAEEIGICSCSSEAYNLAAMALRLKPGDEVVINDLDFPAGATPWLQADCPAEVRLWKSRDGGLDMGDLADILSPRTRLVQVSLVSFFNGYHAPLPAVIETVRRRSSALLAVDVTQGLGRIPLELAEADLIVSSTHKWILSSHGGGLVGVPSARADAWHVPAGGWYNLEDAFGPTRFERAVSRPGATGFMVGMPNFPAIYALRAALKYLRGVTVSAIHDAADPLVRQCLEELSALPVELLTPSEPGTLAGIVAFRHPAAETIARRLHEKQIHVMYHAGRIRIALHGYNTQADVESFLRELHGILRTV